MDPRESILGLAEGIVYDTCLVLSYPQRAHFLQNQLSKTNELEKKKATLQQRYEAEASRSYQMAQYFRQMKEDVKNFTPAQVEKQLEVFPRVLDN